MKTYIGRADGHTVRVADGNGEHVLRFHQRHSPTGYSWGYAGSGPAQLALDILWDKTGEEPKPAVYQAFKRDIIAVIPTNAPFELPESVVAGWLANYHAS